MKYFKTDGIRGVFGASDLSIELILKVGYSFDIFNENKVLIGYDTRYSSKIILQALKYALEISGKTVFDYGVISTPALEYLTKKKRTIGIMITASHNDFTYNGLKIIYKGHKLDDSLKEKLEKRMEENHKPVKIGSYRENKCPKNYFKFFDSIKIKKKYKIVFDLANGSMCFLNDYLKKRFPDAIMINNEPNGFNINDECGALYPELARKIMIDNDYDIAVSFDGDGDRAIIILKNGKILNGDLLLYFFATELKMKNKLKNNTVIYSLIANRGITNVLEENNIKVKFVNVGDENISSEIKNGVASLGGEKSGHIIFNKKYNYSCGLTTILKFLSMLNEKAIINLNCIKEYYEVSKNYKEIRMINKLENKLKAIVTSGNVIVRRSGTENLFRVILMSPNKCEIIDGLNFLEKWIIAKN
ncbi:phosphoglucosamine mutase [Clostridium sp. CAG:307]|nr:phosphoglucosamine mutase [Clostridium sp. CAG:307]